MTGSRKGTAKVRAKERDITEFGFRDRDIQTRGSATGPRIGTARVVVYRETRTK